MSIETYDEDVVIFTTGAFLKPLKTITSKGTEVWVWHVSEFVDDSYLDGNSFNPVEYADSKEQLLINTTI